MERVKTNLKHRRKLNLVLVPNSISNSFADFKKIAAEIRALAPEISTYVIKDKKRYLLHNSHLILRPTMVFSPTKLYNFFSCRGSLFQGQPLPKSQELRHLQENGIPVPAWKLLTPEHTPDLSDFGPYVVFKPDHAAKGADVKIMRKGRVRWREPKTQYAQYKQVEQNNKNWIIQEFIYTGQWPVSYRVETLFGNALWAWRNEANNARRPLTDKYKFEQGGISIVSAGHGSRFELHNDPEIISLAERAHQAFPKIPLLGIDILKEVPSGNLYVIEVNAIGYTWTASSKPGRNMQAENQIDLASQFSCIQTAARILSEKTKQYAR